jgi:hypothetical protein
VLIYSVIIENEAERCFENISVFEHYISVSVWIHFNLSVTNFTALNANSRRLRIIVKSTRRLDKSAKGGPA